MDSQELRSFVLKLAEIYQRKEWLHYEIDLPGFMALFPIQYRKGIPQRPDAPKELDMDRDTWLAIMVAFREAFS
jgi:hypothetical protein